MMHADRRRGRTVDTRARARSDQQKGITPCSTLKANLPDSGLDRLCYKNGPFVSSGHAAALAEAVGKRGTGSAGDNFGAEKRHLKRCQAYESNGSLSFRIDGMIAFLSAT